MGRRALHGRDRCPHSPRRATGASLGGSRASSLDPPVSAHALGTGERMEGIRYLDLVVLPLAFPIFVIAGFPLLGYAACALARLLQLGIQPLLLPLTAASLAECR